MKIKGRNIQGKKPFEKKKTFDEPKKSKEIICFHCRKRGHIKPNCPLLKKKTKFEKAKKALKAETLSDIECEESDEDISNFCPMANTDSDFDSDNNIEIEVKHPKMSIEVSNYIDELCFEFKVALKRITSLKEEISSLRQQDILQKEKIDFLQKEFH